MSIPDTLHVSVIVATYNRSSRLERLLESLQKMKIPPGIDWEIIVINNNSDDGTEQVIHKYADDGILPIHSFFEKRQGKSFALNRGIAEAVGEIFVFVDDDEWVSEEWLSAVVSATKRYPHNCFGGRVIAAWKCEPPRWLGTQGAYNALRGTAFFCDNGTGDREFGDQTFGDTPGGGNMFFRRSIIEANGPFRTDLGPLCGLPGGSEDIEFCRRLLQRGEKFMYVSEAVVYHPVEASRLKRRDLLRWRYHVARSDVRAFRQEVPTSAKIAGVPRYLFRQIIDAGVCWGFSIDTKRRFFYCMRMMYLLGEMIEHHRISRNSERYQVSE